MLTIWKADEVIDFLYAGANKEIPIPKTEKPSDAIWHMWAIRLKGFLANKLTALKNIDVYFTSEKKNLKSKWIKGELDKLLKDYLRVIKNAFQIQNGEIPPRAEDTKPPNTDLTRQYLEYYIKAADEVVKKVGTDDFKNKGFRLKRATATLAMLKRFQKYLDICELARQSDRSASPPSPDRNPSDKASRNAKVKAFLRFEGDGLETLPDYKRLQQEIATKNKELSRKPLSESEITRISHDSFLKDMTAKIQAAYNAVDASDSDARNRSFDRRKAEYDNAKQTREQLRKERSERFDDLSVLEAATKEVNDFWDETRTLVNDYGPKDGYELSGRLVASLNNTKQMAGQSEVVKGARTAGIQPIMDDTFWINGSSHIIYELASKQTDPNLKEHLKIPGITAPTYTAVSEQYDTLKERIEEYLIARREAAEMNSQSPKKGGPGPQKGRLGPKKGGRPGLNGGLYLR